MNNYITMEPFTWTDHGQIRDDQFYLKRVGVGAASRRNIRFYEKSGSTN